MRKIMTGFLLFFIISQVCLLSNIYGAVEDATTEDQENTEFVDDGPRPLFIGDIIQLEIDAREISKDTILEAFQEFGIVDINEENEMWVIRLRSMEAGTKTVTVGDQTITIEIASTLDLINREDIYEVVSIPQNDSLLRNQLLIIASVASGCVFLVTLVLLLIRYFKKKKRHRVISFKERWRSDIHQVNVSEKSCLGTMTVLLKEYLSYMTGKQFLGLSSDELQEALGSDNYYEMINEKVREEIEVWLRDCDGIKYKKSTVDQAYNEVLRGRLINIINDLEVALEKHNNEEKRHQA